jgi:hypothetical protein
MGTGKAGCGRKGLHTKNKQYKRGHDLKRRGRDLDQVQDDMKKVDSKTGKPVVSVLKFDDDLPGNAKKSCTSPRNVHAWQSIHTWLELS